MKYLISNFPFLPFSFPLPLAFFALFSFLSIFRRFLFSFFSFLRFFYFHHFLIVKSPKNGVFSFVFHSSYFSHFFISFTSLIFPSSFWLFFVIFLSVYISFSSLTCSYSEIPQFWFKGRFVHRFFIF